MCAEQARDQLSNFILNRNITLKNLENEKYGRIFADVYLDEININEWLIKERFAVEFNPTKNYFPKSWLKYKITGEF